MRAQNWLCAMFLICAALPAISAGPTSHQNNRENEASRVFEAAKPALLHLKVVGTESAVDAVSGSGFVIDAAGRVATNYHVVSDVVMKPNVYRLRYKAVNGQAGVARIVAIDIANDLAILETDYRAASPLRISKSDPVRGQVVYSLGFPNRQAETVTQGLYNGPVAHRYVPRFHFTGPINPGMSGGPAINAKGEVFGVNVESGRNQQLVSYLVPAQALSDLHGRVEKGAAATDVREVERQLTVFGNSLIERLLTERRPSIRLGGYLVAGETALLKCAGTTNLDSSGDYETTSHYCSPRSDLWVSNDIDQAGEITLFATRTRNLKMDPYRFTESAAAGVTGEPAPPKTERGPFACRYKTVALQGMRVRAEICVAQYRQFDLADYIVNLATIDRSDEQLSATLALRTLPGAPAKRFIKAVLEGMAWAPASTSKS